MFFLKKKNKTLFFIFFSNLKHKGTIRRCLERKELGDNIFSIVFAVDHLEDYEIYNNVMRLYFPRNERDLIESKDKYPEDIDSLNEVGASVITERQIRIAEFPAGKVEKKKETEEDDDTAKRVKIDTTSGLKAFMTPTTGTPDERLRMERARKTPKQREEEQLDATYDRLLQAAKKDDLSDIARRNCVYQSGVDATGRPIIILAGARFPEKTDKQAVQRLTKYILRTIDPILNSNFVIIYFHACTTQPQEPEFGWLKLMYRFCERHYLPTLSNFIIVHPSLWIKFTMKLLSPWLLAAFKKKLRYMGSLNELFSIFDHGSLKIPDFVYRYDQKENGSSYLTDDNPANEGL